VHLTTAALLGLPLLAYLVLRLSVVGFGSGYSPLPTDDLTGNPLRGLALLERLPASMAVFWFYLTQLVWPDLAFSHVPARLPTWTSPGTWLGAMGLLALAAALAFAVRRRSLVALGLTLLLGQYLIVSNLLFVTGVYASNRLMAPMLLGAAMVLAVGLHRLTGSNLRRLALALIPSAGLTAVYGLVVIVVANPAWSSTLAKMQADLMRHSPTNPVAMYLLGTALAEDGSYHEALPWLRKAVELRPGSAQARRQLAAVAMRTRNLEEAATQYRQLIELTPAQGNLRARIDLAYIALSQNRLEDAERHLQAAAELAPTHPDVMHNLAVLAVRRQRWTEAVRRYESLLIQHPDHSLGQQEYADLRRQLEHLLPRQ
jgi:tetratricopeptide (TPR) repeat protein